MFKNLSPIFLVQYEYYNHRASEYDEIYEGKYPAIPEPSLYKNDVKRLKEMIMNFGREFCSI